jgi:protein subunit release factor A
MKYKTDLKSLRKESKILRSLSSGPGGQRRDKKETAVSIHHLPSGVSVKISESRFQKKNEEIAFRLLKKRIEKINTPKKKRISTKVPLKEKRKRIKKKKKISKKKDFRKDSLIEE